MPSPIEPSISETAFSCPHCSAFTTQYWYALYSEAIGGDKPVPFLPGEKERQHIANDREISLDVRQGMLDWFAKVQTGLVIFDRGKLKNVYDRVYNLHLSKCYNCKKIAVWVHDRLLFPVIKAGVLPNPDLPEDVLRDFEEAREIVNPSPRGAAALLRLCVQKLCKHLGEKGKNIDDDIASLVAKGLNPLVQQSLDIVRVVGNEAVHPGVLDLKDDRGTALLLFDLVNAIAEQMISHPKVVTDMYAKLPEDKRKAIEARDSKSRKT
jgi:hypothetical protein